MWYRAIGVFEINCQEVHILLRSLRVAKELLDLKGVFCATSAILDEPFLALRDEWFGRV